LRKPREHRTSGKAEAAFIPAANRETVSENSPVQAKALSSPQHKQTSESMNAGPWIAAQRKLMTGLINRTSHIAKNNAESQASSGQAAQLLPAYKDSSTVDHDKLFSDAAEKEVSGKAGAADSTSEHLGIGMEAYSAGDGFVGAVTHDSSALSLDDMEWKSDGSKRDDDAQKDWLKGSKHTSKDVDALKAEEATKSAVTGSIGTALSFLKVPAMWQKFNKAETNYEKFELALEGASLGSSSVATGAKIADASSGGQDKTAQDTSSISEYTSGIINLVKSAYKSCLALKDAREEYLLIKENTDEDPSKLDAAKIAFEGALSLTGGILTSVNDFQKSFGAAQNLALKTAIPAIGIALSAISLMGRFITVLGKEKVDLGKTAEAAQSDAILASVKGAENKEKVKGILESSHFRQTLKTMAEYRQQERDNPAIFAEYRKAEGDKALQQKLKKRYPQNYERIERIYLANKLGVHDVSVECQKLIRFGVSKEVLDSIVEDQTLIDHLQEIKSKRRRNAKIGIATDLVNIGADIAILSGAGATVGAAMKAGTAAVDVARKAGNAVKFAARSKGAESFAGGAEGGLFGASMFDTADILKSDKAKQERYFQSSRLLLDNMAGHDKKADSLGSSPSEAELKANDSSYEWVEAKILGTGASVTVVKAMLNSGAKTGNDIVKYFMDKMKAR